jgi:hypothetical protein
LQLGAATETEEIIDRTRQYPVAAAQLRLLPWKRSQEAVAVAVAAEVAVAAVAVVAVTSPLQPLPLGQQHARGWQQ